MWCTHTGCDKTDGRPSYRRRMIIKSSRRLQGPHVAETTTHEYSSVVCEEPMRTVLVMGVIRKYTRPVLYQSSFRRNSSTVPIRFGNTPLLEPSLFGGGSIESDPSENPNALRLAISHCLRGRSRCSAHLDVCSVPKKKKKKKSRIHTTNSTRGE